MGALIGGEITHEQMKKFRNFVAHGEMLEQDVPFMVTSGKAAALDLWNGMHTDFQKEVTVDLAKKYLDAAMVYIQSINEQTKLDFNPYELFQRLNEMKSKPFN